jgi:RHS repeat-associated protein
VLEEIDSKYEVVQEAAYYPFGLAIPSQSFALPDENDTYQNRYLYNGKELQDDFGLNWYDYGARFYDAQIGRWHSVDPLAEKYISFSPYAFVGNNPIVNREIDGKYFEEGSSHEKTANRIERRAERRADRLERRADRREERGRDVGDLRERTSELRQSAQDIRDMREDPNTMYRYTTIGSGDANAIRAVGPQAIMVGQNHEGHDLVYLVTERNIETRLHESRHGGQHARRELDVGNPNTYRSSHEISAYSAQYAYRGRIKYYIGKENWTDEKIGHFIQHGPSSLERRITNINQINNSFLKTIVDNPGPTNKFLYRNNPSWFWD